MPEVIFKEKSELPSKDDLKRVLGDELFSCYEKLEEITKACVKEWKHYNKKQGYSYKISRGKKALCYFTPYEACFNVGMAIRESEFEDLRGREFAESVTRYFEDPQKYPEGFAFRFEITSAQKFQDFVPFLLATLEIRK